MKTENTTERLPSLYRSIWRWHFYAGLVVAPFMLILAVTGAIYLFNDEINDLLYNEQRFVKEQLPAKPASELITAALNYYPGSTATRIDMPTAPGRTATVFVTLENSEAWRVYVDPGTAEALGSYVYTKTLVGFADVFHGSLLLGDVGDAIVELMACWGLVLIVTGLYLWWPRKGSGLVGTLLPRFNLRGRKAWREWHSVTGFWTAALLAFLIITGLPWATVWGGFLRAGTDALDIGYPASHRMHGAAPSAETLQQALGDAPWTLENEPMPESHVHHSDASEPDPHADHHGGGHGVSSEHLAMGIGVDRATEIFEKQGFSNDYRLFLPKNPQGIYTAYTYPDRPQGQRTMHLDQYTGKVLGDVTFADYGWAAQAIELGVQLHMGNYFGRLNQLLMLFACLGAIALSITGPIMWWKRRPKGQLAAPKPLAPIQMRNIAWITLGFMLLFPLAGLSLVVILIGEKILGLVRNTTKPF